jgi:hypothetical protein
MRNGMETDRPQGILAVMSEQSGTGASDLTVEVPDPSGTRVAHLIADLTKLQKTLNT